MIRNVTIWSMVVAIMSVQGAASEEIKKRNLGSNDPAERAMIASAIAETGRHDPGAPQRLKLDCGKGVTMEFVLIPAGEFMMGATHPPGEFMGASGEGPVHRVRITRPFYMGAYEVTQEQYEAVMGVNPSCFKGAQNPVETVSWKDAQEFCKRLSAKSGMIVHLPTEAEWEYACRAGTPSEYSSGNGLSALKETGWCSYDGKWGSAGGTKPVGSFKSNAFGLYDMHGNVWEWCQSLRKGYPYRSDDGREDLHASGSRVLRGGSWFNKWRYCQSASRAMEEPAHRGNSNGFRVAAVSLSPKAASEPKGSIDQRRERLNNAIDEMSRIGSRDDPIMKRFDMRIDATSTGLVEALGRDDAPLDEVQQNAAMLELLVEGKTAYANIEQSRARLVLNRLLRRVRDLGDADLSQVSETKLREAEKLLQYMGPEQPFFDKAREQWQELRAALRLDESSEQSLAQTDLNETSKLVVRARQCGSLCYLIVTAEELRFTPGALSFDDLMKKEGIDKELAALGETFVENETVDMERLKAVGAKLKALVVRAMAAEKSDVKASKSGGREERGPR